MGLFEQLPYTNFHNLNLTEMVRFVNELGREMRDFEALNKIKYVGDWDITKQYEAWSVVCVNGTEGYISIRPVPTGVNYTNNNYWRLIADFTVQLAGLANRVSDLENDMTGAQNDITSLQSDMTTALNDSSNALTILSNNQIIDCESCVWIGDSYTSAGSLGADVDKRFSTKVSNQLGLVEHNYAVGGTGYMYGTTPYTTQSANAVTDFTNNDYDRTKVKYIFIMGNRNDADGSYSYSNYQSAVQSVLNTLSNFFINATIVVIPGMWDAKPCKQLMIRYCNIIEETCQNNNRVLFIDNAWTWLTGHENEILWQNGADVHPNVTGHQRLTSHILNALKGNNYNEIRWYEFTPTTTHADVSDCTCLIKVVNNIATFFCRFKTSSATLSGNIFTHTFSSLALSNLLIIDTQQYCKVQTRNNTANVPRVTINQVLTKTDDVTGSLYTNMYTYSGFTYDTAGWNWVEFSIPYGIKTTNMN